MNHPLRVLIVTGLSATAILRGQALKKDDYLPPEKLPRAVQLQVLGDRLQVHGKETGTYRVCVQSSDGGFIDPRGWGLATPAVTVADQPTDSRSCP